MYLKEFQVGKAGSLHLQSISSTFPIDAKQPIHILQPLPTAIGVEGEGEVVISSRRITNPRIFVISDSQIGKETHLQMSI